MKIDGEEPVKTSNTNFTADVKTRTRLANRRIIELQDLWKDRNLTTALKMKCVKMLVWSVLLYGLEGWTLTKAYEKRLLCC